MFNLQATARLVSSPAISILTAHSVKTCNICSVVFHNKTWHFKVASSVTRLKQSCCLKCQYLFCLDFILEKNNAALSRNVSSARCSRSSPESWSNGGTVAEGENGIASLLIMDHNQPRDYRENWVLIEPQLYVNCFFLTLLFYNQQSLLDMRSNNQKRLWNSNADPQRQAVQYVCAFPQ